jgi:hypothetical protein
MDLKGSMVLAVARLERRLIVNRGPLCLHNIISDTPGIIPETNRYNGITHEEYTAWIMTQTFDERHG